MHTNICSLQANTEKLEILLHELEFKFDVISLTETWNPEQKIHNFNPKILDGYNEYIGTTGTNCQRRLWFLYKQRLKLY